MFCMSRLNFRKWFIGSLFHDIPVEFVFLFQFDFFPGLGCWLLHRLSFDILLTCRIHLITLYTTYVCSMLAWRLNRLVFSSDITIGSSIYNEYSRLCCSPYSSQDKQPETREDLSPQHSVYALTAGGVLLFTLDLHIKYAWPLCTIPWQVCLIMMLLQAFYNLWRAKRALKFP